MQTTDKTSIKSDLNQMHQIERKHNRYQPSVKSNDITTRILTKTNQNQTAMEDSGRIINKQKADNSRNGHSMFQIQHEIKIKHPIE
jgi:hypothetical protein